MHLRGASVAVLDLNAEEAREAAERIGPRAIGLAADVTDQNAMFAAVAEVVEKFGGLDVAVANAGIAQKQFATARGDLRRGMGTGLRGRPARRLAHGAGGAAADRRAPGPDGRRLLRLRLRQRHGQHPLRGRQGRGRGARPLAAGRARPARRQRQRRLLRLGRHQAGPGRLRPGGLAGRIRELSPDFLLKRITPDEAGAGLVRGIEERAPRIFVPKWWRYVSALRGLVNPLLDRRMESDAKTRALIRDLDAKSVDAGKS